MGNKINSIAMYNEIYEIYNKDKIIENITKKDLKVGDWISRIMNAKLIKKIISSTSEYIHHHGIITSIVEDNIYITHYNLTDGKFGIITSKLEVFLADCNTINIYRHNVDSISILNRIKNIIKIGNYNINYKFFYNNCEHFVQEAIFSIKRSSQVEILIQTEKLLSKGNSDINYIYKIVSVSIPEYRICRINKLFYQ